jgi:hypothetical protein
MERSRIESGGTNPGAVASVIVGYLAIACGPAAVLLSEYSETVTLRHGVAIGAGVTGALAVLTLLLARRGKLRAQRSVTGARAGSARIGRLLGTLALCVAIAGAIALITDTVLTRIQHPVVG